MPWWKVEFYTLVGKTDGWACLGGSRWALIEYLVENSQHPKLIKLNDIVAPKSHGIDLFYDTCLHAGPVAGNLSPSQTGKLPSGSPSLRRLPGASLIPCFGFREGCVFAVTPVLLGETRVDSVPYN